MGSFADLEGRRPLGNTVTPRTLTHVLLAFDVAADAKSSTLHMISSDGSDADVTILLHK